jgi:CubicO group peptidase (beta-lactamase class C family)
MSVTDFTQTRLWDRLGMEFAGAWAPDRDDGFEKMEAGLNAWAADYAKLGVLYRDLGAVNDEQVISANWVDASVSPDAERDRSDYYIDDFGQEIYADGSGYYGRMWYGRIRPGQAPDFAAEGDHGQFIYVSPSRDLVIVRNGTDYGRPSSAWVDAFYACASLQTPVSQSGRADHPESPAARVDMALHRMPR